LKRVVISAEHGRSTEAEHREILRQALMNPRRNFKAFLESMPDAGDDADFERDRSSPGAFARKLEL
jgi:antitoxin FitA